MSVVIQQEDPHTITIWQGKSWDMPFAFTQDDGVTPIPIVGILKGQIRDHAGVLMASFDLTWNGSAGTGVASLTPTATWLITRPGVYDIEEIDGSTVTGWLHGPAYIIPGVTQ